jgi:hypothetical protein
MGNHRKSKTLLSKKNHKRRKGYVIFFTIQGPAIQIVVSKGKSVKSFTKATPS